MTCLEWSRQTTALREGRLRLLAPEEDGLSMFARRSVYDLREYLAALEAGYRRICEELDGYRKRERVRPAVRAGDMSLQELVENQWSEGACLGYAVMGLRQAGFSPKDAICVLEAMEDAMQIYDLTAAAEAHQALVEDPGRLPRGGSGPEWIGASAELKPEVPSC